MVEGDESRQQLYKRMIELSETIPAIQKELKRIDASIKSRTGKLNSRLMQLENLDFQSQIVAIDDKLKLVSKRLDGISSGLDELERAIEVQHLNALQAGIMECVRHDKNLFAELMADTATVRQLVRGTEPQPAALVNAFRKRWTEKMRDAGISFIET